MSAPNSVPDPEHLLAYFAARDALAKVLAEHLNVTLYENYDEETDEEFPVETRQLLDLAGDLLDQLDMIGLDLAWKDEGARLLAEASQ